MKIIIIKKLPSLSERLVVKERSEDLIRFKSPAEWFVYRKWFFRWSAVEDAVSASGFLIMRDFWLLRSLTAFYNWRQR